MLLELRIRDYAVIERLTLRLGPGLNALTGETGAGKSIIVGALSLLLGERATADAVRPGAKRAVVEGVFDIAGRADLASALDEHGLEPEEGLLILRREVAAEGRNRAWVNGTAATASLVGRLGSALVGLHGQHEHEALLHEAVQRTILDAFGDAAELAAAVAAADARVRQAARSLDGLAARRCAAAERVDLLRAMAAEIEGARLRPGEEESLAAEARRLEHAEQLARLARQLHQGLYAADDSITARLHGMRRAFTQLVGVDPDAGQGETALDDAFHALQELGRRMGSYAAAVEYDPVRLDAIRRRQDLLFRLRSRYGPSLEDVRDAGRRAREELDLLESGTLDEADLRRELDAAMAARAEACARLTAARRGATDRLRRRVARLLPALGMPGGRFEVALEAVEPGPHGAERVEFRVSLNAGFQPRPLARVASGGELSRVMLALKAVLAAVDRTPTLVFDEIDAGIGGRVAHQVGARLREVAARHQVLVVTHLPQIAARADHHVAVEKVSRRGVTAADVHVLEGEARIRELARMLGGDPESAAGLEHARELLGAGHDG
jgi:DNA repair protein RecN (Recombination protein N)